MRRLIAAAALAVVSGVGAAMLTASPAMASTCTAYLAGHSWWSQCQTGGTGGSGGSSGGSSASSCYYLAATAKQLAAAQLQPAPKGEIYLTGPYCTGIQTLPLVIQLFQNGGAQPTAAGLAQQALARLMPPLPLVSTAPPRGGNGLVGLPEWFWVPRSEWRPVSIYIGVGPVWARVTARPSRLTFLPGGGQAAVSCPGPGSAYNPSLPASAQSTNCSYTYAQPSAGQPGNAYSATVSITWTATWVGSGGTGGTLPSLTTTANFALPVASGQALVSR